MKVFLVQLLLLGLVSTDVSIFSDNYIGLHKDKITEMFSEKHKSFKLNKSYVNNSYNYLKYEDSIREITALYFLTDDNYCRMIRIMSDYSNINDLRDELNENYDKQSKNKWQYESNKTTYEVQLKEEDWFFTISIKEKED